MPCTARILKGAVSLPFIVKLIKAQTQPDGGEGYSGMATGYPVTIPGKEAAYCYATHLLENGVNIRIVQELMGHADVKNTEIYTRVMQKNLAAAASPLDTLRNDGPD